MNKKLMDESKNVRRKYYKYQIKLLKEQLNEKMN